MVNEKWDLSQIYSSNEDFESDFKIVQGLAEKLEGFKGKLKLEDKDIMREYFAVDDEFSSLLEKLAVFVHCKNDDDGKCDENVKNYMRINDFYAKVSEKLSFIRSEMTSLSTDFLNELLSDEDFKDYSRVIESFIRDKDHSPTEREQNILATVSGFSSFDDIYSSITDIEMAHGSFVDDKGETVTLTTGNYNLHLKNKSQDYRKKVMETYLGEYKRFNLTIANLYASNIKQKSFVARLNKFNSVLDMSTFGEEVTDKIMMKNIEYVSKNAPLMQKYFDLKREILGLEKFYTCDLNADFDFGEKQLETFEQATVDINNAFAPLGKDYQDMFKTALDSGWIDALPRENKASGGYTISTYLTHPYILLNYDGTAYWKSAIAHEFGHAMHSYYSCKNQPLAKSSYTIFVAEVASLTNEILLSKYLLSKETDKQKKMQILADFLALFYLNVSNSSMLAEFEFFAHSMVWNGETLTHRELNDEYAKICKKYFGDSVTFTENFEYDWERKSHIFRDYYLYKYSTGLVCACAAASNILSDKTGEYVKKYKKFLSLGDSLSPLESLKVAGIDITDEKTYDFAFSMFEEYLNNLKNLYEGE